VLPDPAATAWNREVLYADVTTPEALVSAGLALPLLGDRRVVLVRGVGELGAKAVERLRLAVEGARGQPGGWPTAGTTLLLVAVGLERKSPVLRLVPEAEQVEARPPAGRAVTGWLQARARGMGLTLTPAAAEMLIGLVGDDLSRLAGELTKAAILVGSEGQVTEEVVTALVGESRVRQYWELGQALEDGDQPRALRVLDQLLAAGEEPTPLLGQIVGYLRDVWRVKAALTEGRDARQMAKVLPRPRPPFAVQRLIARADAVPGAMVEAAVTRCFDVERRLKSGEGEPRALLTALVADVARG
jgi:DNA polymerase III subunit delta